MSSLVGALSAGNASSRLPRRVSARVSARARTGAGMNDAVRFLDAVKAVARVGVWAARRPAVEEMMGIWRRWEVKREDVGRGEGLCSVRGEGGGEGSAWGAIDFMLDVGLQCRGGEEEERSGERC